MHADHERRKDVERAFGVLQAHFVVVCGPAKQWDPKTLWEVMTWCLIMHNMVIEDDGEDAAVTLEFEHMSDPIELLDQNFAIFEEFSQMQQKYSASTNSRTAGGRSGP